MIRHPYVPEHATERSYPDNEPACCDRPESGHPAWTGTTRLRLTRNVSNIGTPLRKGDIVDAERSAVEYMRVVRPSRWGTIPDGPYAGTFAELDKGQIDMVKVPTYTVREPGPNGYLIGIPLHYGKEVPA